jgi:hypothetical protein
MKSSSTFYLSVPDRRLRAEESEAFIWAVIAPERSSFLIAEVLDYLNLMSDI